MPGVELTEWSFLRLLCSPAVRVPRLRSEPEYEINEINEQSRPPNEAGD